MGLVALWANRRSFDFAQDDRFVQQIYAANFKDTLQGALRLKRGFQIG